MSPPYADRRERRFREPDLRRGCRVKVVSQRKTRAVDHHHPLRPLAPLGFPDSTAPFLAGAKLPSRNDSLHFRCWRWFKSLSNARQMFSQMPCSSQSRSRRQHVEGCGYFPGRSCPRAPLRRIHKMPSSALRSGARGRGHAVGRCVGAEAAWEAGAESSPTARRSATDRIAPSALPLALPPPVMLHLRKPNHRHFRALHGVVQQLLTQFGASKLCSPVSEGCCRRLL